MPRGVEDVETSDKNCEEQPVVSVAFCSPAKSSTFGGLMGKPTRWQKVKVLTSKQHAQKLCHAAASFCHSAASFCQWAPVFFCHCEIHLLLPLHHLILWVAVPCLAMQSSLGYPYFGLAHENKRTNIYPLSLNGQSDPGKRSPTPDSLPLSSKTESFKVVRFHTVSIPLPSQYLVFKNMGVPFCFGGTHSLWLAFKGKSKRKPTIGDVSSFCLAP